MLQGKRGTQTGLYGKVVAFLEATPEKMFTWHDIKEEFDLNDVAAQNAVYNMHRAGRIQRHVDKDESKNWRYAFEIEAGKSDLYIPAERTSGRQKADVAGKPRSYKKRKGQLPSAKEVRTMFAQTQNQLAKTEDMIIAIAEEYEELERMINKIKNITS